MLLFLQQQLLVLRELLLSLVVVVVGKFGGVMASWTMVRLLVVLMFVLVLEIGSRFGGGKVGNVGFGSFAVIVIVLVGQDIGCTGQCFRQ